MSFARTSLALGLACASFWAVAQQAPAPTGAAPATAAPAANVGALTKAQANRILLLDAARAGNRTIAVGDRGYILASDDNGDTWRRVAAPTAPLLTAVFFADAQTGWAVGHDSIVLGTGDGGNTWSKLFSAPDEQKPLMDVYFAADKKNGIAIGAYGAFYASADSGKTWAARKISQEDKHLNAIVALTDNRLLVVGEAGTILFSSDAGATWTPSSSPYKGSYFGAIEAADKSIVIFGMRGRVFRSTDGGANWAPVEIKVGDKPLQSSLMGGSRLTDGTIVLAGVQGAAVVSRDNGASFTRLATKSTRPYSNVVQATSNALILLGEAGPTDFILPSK